MSRLQLAIGSTDFIARSAEIGNQNDRRNFGASDVRKIFLYI